MANTGSTTVNSILGYPLIAGRVNQLGPVHQVLTGYYGVALRDGGNGSLQGGFTRSDNRDIVYDIYNTTRLTPQVKSPGTGATHRKRFPIGKANAVGIRSFEKIQFLEEELRNQRVLGGPLGRPDARGRRYVAQQVDNHVRTFLNMREWSFASMLKGKLYLKKDGPDGWTPVATSAEADIEVDYKVPAGHKDQLAVGTGGADLIDTTFSDTDADILGMLAKVNRYSLIATGMPATEYWMNSLMWRHFMQNTKVQAEGGSSFRAWETQQMLNANIAGPNQGQPINVAPYQTYTLRASGNLYRFHVYDGVIELGGGDTQATSDASTYFIPDNQLLITPPPTMTDWFDAYDILELYKDSYDGPSKDAYGMQAWARADLNSDVPQHVTYMLDNHAYALTVPKSVLNPTVVF